ncbi:P-loop containing nucleoside triphosphate hydrolase protein [Zopfochytrium polystomum]|nr:P-loop containing nucleoside triphosphate hydrolase protein [Zopfochytrium polystomum]
MSPALFLQSTLFANRANRLLQLINSLRDSGAQLNFDLNLPTVVVCGNQSAGKSSVIEALCGVPLPRADGTCTRTVTEVRMIADSDSGAERSAAWSCSVKLRYEYDEVGGPKATANATPMRAPREVPFGGPVQDPFMAEQLIRQAQRALLNPSSDPLLYCDTNAWRTKGSNELSFSRNVVCLEIFGAAVNLSLIDLPGIIRSVDRSEDAPYIDMIQDLVLSYIRQERSIIVGVITCKDEIENQAIVRMAKEVDPTGSRTIGVLTKPDTIESGTHDRWLSVMLGQTYALRLGYWMVKNPSKSELDQRINFEDARVKEETFFASRSPWANLRFQMDRFGVESLRNELGRHLANLIDSSVPTIKVRAEELLSATEVELNALPPPPLSNQFNLSPPSSTGISYVTSDPRIELLQMIRRLASRVALHLAAQERDYKQFYQIVRGHFEAFRRGLHSTRPLFAMEKPVAAGATRAPMEEKSSSSASSSSTSGYSSSLTSSVSWAISSVVWSSSSSTVEESKKKDSEKKFASQTSTKRLASSSPPSIHLMSPPPPQQRRSSSGSNGGLRPISLSDLRRIIESHKGRELQGTHVPPGAFTTVVSMFQEEWGRLASVCLTNISNDLHSLLSHLIEEEFGRFADLRGHVCNLVEAVLSEHYQSASIKLADLVAMERRLPFTLNQEEFVRLRGSALAEFRSQMDASMGRSSNSTKSSSSSLPSLLGSAPPTAPPESWTRAIAAISELGYPQLTPRDLALRLDTALAPSSSSSQQVGSAQSSNTPTASPKPGGGSLYSFASATSPAADEDELLQVMASSDAYFRLAFRRLSDVVPMHVDYFFLARLGETVEKELVVGLGVLERPPEDLLELLQEDRVIAERRRVLQDRKARLEGVWRALTEAVRTPAGLGLSRD